MCFALEVGFVVFGVFILGDTAGLSWFWWFGGGGFAIRLFVRALVLMILVITGCLHFGLGLALILWCCVFVRLLLCGYFEWWLAGGFVGLLGLLCGRSVCLCFVVGLCTCCVLYMFDCVFGSLGERSCC